MILRRSVRLTAIIVLLISAGTGMLGAEALSFQYGAIPFGISQEEILSQAGSENTEFQSIPATQFLSCDNILKENVEDPIFLFFDGALQKTVSWGDAYVNLYEEFTERVDLRLPNQPRADLFFFDPGNGVKRLLMVHKMVLMDGDFNETFSNLEGQVSAKIGIEPEIDRTRFRGYSYELYAETGLWQTSNTTVFIVVREKNLQSKLSVAEYVYIDTKLWKKYKERVKGLTGNTNGIGDTF